MSNVMPELPGDGKGLHMSTKTTNLETVAGVA